MDRIAYQTHAGCIEIGSNVFVGGGTIIVGPCHIGNNVIIAAGSVVTKNIQSGVVVGGNPAKVIGYFDDIKERRSDDSGKNCFNPEDSVRKSELWDEFYKAIE